MLAPPAVPPPGPGARSTGRVLAILGLAGCVGVFALVMVAGSRPSSARARASMAREAEPAAATGRAAPGAVDRTPLQAAAIDHARAAVASFRGGDVGGAIQQFTAAVDADPDDAGALNNLGQSLVRAGRAGEAVPYFDRAIERSPGTWSYHFNRARAYGELRAWPQAIDSYRRAAQLFPEDYATQFNLAHALQANGDLPAAIDAFQRAAALAPGETGFLLSLAAAQEAAQRPADAAATYRRYLELEPAAPEADKIRDRIARLAP